MSLWVLHLRVDLQREAGGFTKRSRWLPLRAWQRLLLAAGNFPLSPGGVGTDLAGVVVLGVSLVPAGCCALSLQPEEVW